MLYASWPLSYGVRLRIQAMWPKRRVHPFFLALVALPGLLGPRPILAQGVTTAALAGRVETEGGAPLEGVRVELRDERTGAVSVTLTGPNGRYYLPNLRPGGPYRLRLNRLGYATIDRGKIRLELGQLFRADFLLAEEAVALPEIEVEVRPDPDFGPSRMGVATLIDEEMVERLPTLTRNFVEFASLSPLAKVSDDGVSIAGANFRFNNIQVDGAMNQDVFGLSPSGVAGGRGNGRIVPLEAIEQLQVLIAPYDVRQSGFTGGLLNAVTRTGTNEWKGAAFGYYRAEGLVGDLEVDGVSARPDDLDNLFLGATLGGPIVRDRVHLFAAAEFERRRQPPSGFHVGRDDPIRTQLSPDSVDRFERILTGYGAAPGEAGVYTLENNLANVFARVDFQIGERHKGLLRYNYAGVRDDPPANRLPGDAYEFSSGGTETETNNHSAIFQLLSNLSSRLSNDFLVNLQFIRDRERALTDYARVELEVTSQVEEETFTQRLRAGANLFAHASELDQDVLQITNNLTWAIGRNRLLAGASLERYGIRRRFLPGSLGSYRFASLADLEANRPSRYDVLVPTGEASPDASFSVLQWAAYVQDELSVGDWLTLRLGIRVDVPTLPDEPAFNPAVEEDFGLSTSRMPSANPLVSPRFGFNIRLGSEGGTQIRGGAGLFTGRPPFAWLANAYLNTGLSTVAVTCEGDNAPGFDPTAPAPTACLDGTGAEAGLPTVNVFDPDFRFPQDFKLSLGIDQRLPLGFVGSVDAVYSKAVHQIFMEELNLQGRVPADQRIDENGYTDGFGFGTRESFGIPGQGFGGEPPFLPSRRSDRFAQVIGVTNRDDNFAYAIAVELKRRFSNRYALMAGYSFSRSADTQSLLSLDAVTNFGLVPIEGDPNHPKRQASLFDQPHKVVVSASGRFFESLGGTEVTLLYIGQSGRPYSYVYLGDVNGDGYDGTGRAQDLTNDLIYVPELATEFPGGVGVSAFLLESLKAMEPCLQENVTRVLFRNACRAPWFNRLDVRLSQRIRAGRAGVQIIFDMLNVLNFVNGDWGHVRTVNPAVQLLALDGREEDDFDFSDIPEPDDPLVQRYIGPVERTEQGGFRAALPTVLEIPNSQWQAQFGIRVSF